MFEIHFVRDEGIQIVFDWTNTQENRGPDPKETIKGRNIVFYF